MSSVVVRERLIESQNLALGARVGNVRIGRNAELGDHGRTTTAGVVDEEAAIARVARMECQAKKAALTTAGDT